MSNITFEELDMDGVFLITSFFSGDDRGSFVKFFEKDIFSESGIKFSCNEIFASHSKRNVIRGLHFQTENPQAKLISVMYGKVFDVIVDLRKKSKTYGQWRGFYLSDGNRNSLYVPRGCAHGFLSLNELSIVSYTCDGPYNGQTDTGIKFDDPDIKIGWPIEDASKIIVSSRDSSLQSFADFDKINHF